ncbi:MAG: RES family NAD+ phosphorylase [Bryobacteraceae bacterium]
MRVARICRAKYPDLEGKGAAVTGGRWNSKGTAVVYTSSCGALAVLEYRVHTSVDPADLLLYRLELPESLTVERAGWMPDLATSRKFGDVWAASMRSPVLIVPSVVVPHQVNVLLNPAHPALLGNIVILDRQSFLLDVRLFDLTQSDQ